MTNYFKNRNLVIATMHQKEVVIKPLLEKELWVSCFVLKDFNTDIFGTFTREIKRTGDMLDAARLKINYAMDISWCDLGISSEWSFWSHYWLPLINSNFELTLIIDRKNNLEIIWHHLSPDTNVNGKYITSIEDVIKTSKDWGFPGHGIIVRLKENSRFFIDKDINNESELEKSVYKILSLPFIKKAYIETDMRANRNPTRMKNIELSVKDLLKNINLECPKCWTPWFTITDIEWWLACWLCLLPTSIPIYEIHTCSKCKFTQKVKIEKYGNYADPWECLHCNP